MKGFATTKDREVKAKKIEAVLQDFLERKIKKVKILEVGCGSGVISEYFSKNNEVWATDLETPPLNKRGFKFVKVRSENLPFKNQFFDIVISNHVIEHLPNQALHLEEIRRVLKKEGVCYLATPNKLFPIEPHYKIPLIHYLPNRVFWNILRFFGRYEEDLYLLNYFSLKAMLKEYNPKEYTHEIIKYPKKFGLKIPIINKLPLLVLNKLNFISPTNIFVLKK